MTGRVTSERSLGSVQAVRPLLAKIGDSELALDVVRLAAETRLALDDDNEHDSLLFAFEGSGSLMIGEDTHALAAQAAALVAAGEQFSLEAGRDGLAVLRTTVGPGAELHAPLGPRDAVVRLSDAASDRATGARSFEVLLGPHNGCTRATLFVGHVPPGRAPWHYHLYDEIVWIPDGLGRLHLGSDVEELEPGTAFRLRPREVHVVENASDETDMALVGVFTPAGSPSAAYLTAEVASEYRFTGG